MKPCSKLMSLGGLMLTALPTLTAGPLKEVAPPPIVEPEEKNWELRVYVPGWAASIDGELGVLGRTVDADTGFDELVDEMDLVLAAGLDLRVDRFLFAADGSYSEVSFSAEPTGFARRLFKNATLDTKQGIFEAYLGYRIVDTAEFDFDLFAGLRYNYYDMTLTLDGTERRSPRTGRELALTRDRKASTEQEWVDPLIAARIVWQITDPIAFIASGDIGGFEVSSDLTWQAYAAIRADITRCLYTEIGYRHQHTDYTDGGFIYDAALTGPQVILGVRF